MTTQRFTTNGPAGDASEMMGPEWGLRPETDIHSERTAQGEGKKSFRKCKNEGGWRKIVRNFTPSSVLLLCILFSKSSSVGILNLLCLLTFRWFAVTMGTGIVSILLHNLPYNGDWLYWISVVVFCLNIALFVTFTVISIVRYTVFPEIWWAMIRHPAQSLFIGTFPMGLATIINMIVFVCVPAWGDGAVKLVGLLTE